MIPWINRLKNYYGFEGHPLYKQPFPTHAPRPVIYTDRGLTVLGMMRRLQNPRKYTKEE